MKTLLFAIAICVLTACSSTRHLVTGEKGKPIPVESVKLYDSIPATAIPIGVVMVKSSGKGQGAMDRAVKKAKKDAAKLGADGIAVNTVNTGTMVYNWVPVTDTYASFQAFSTK